MICAISPENRSSLEDYHVNGLVTLMEEKKPLDLKSYLSDFYKRLLTPKSNGSVRTNEQALSYIHISPGIMRQVLRSDPDTENYFVTQGLNLSELVRLDNQFINSTTPLETVQQYVGLPENVISNLKQQIEITNKISQESGFNPIPEGSPQKRFNAAPLSVLTTTGQEATTIKDSSGQWVNIADPAKIIRYAYQRNLINQVLSTTENSSQLLQFPGGVFLIAMHSSKVEDYKGSNDVLFVVTDQDGNILSLDKDGKTDGPRQVMYYESRKIIKTGDTYSTSDLAPVSAIVKEYTRMGKPISTKEAEAIRQSQLKQAYDLQEYIKKNPEKNLKTIITGGSLGYVDFDFNIRTPLGAISFSDSPLKVNIQEQQGQPYIKGFDNGGAPYFTAKGIQDPILIQRNEMSPELISKIASIFVDPVNESHAGETYSITPHRRLALIKQYLNNTPTFQVTLDKGLLLLNINGSGVDLLDTENARKIITDYFNTYQNTPGFNPASLTSDQKAGALNESDPDFLSKLRPGIIVKKTSGAYEKYTKPTFNINRDYIDNSIFDDFSLEKQPDNSYLIKSDKIPYYDWLKENTFINYRLNSEGKILALNSYFKYKLTDETESILYPKAEVTKTPVSANPGITEQGFPNTVSPSEAGRSFSDRIKKLKLSKTVDQKLFSESATKKQIEEARAWYENSLLNKYFPFEAAFNIVNSGSIAKWTIDGVTLYHGSDYSDLYHESWHGFSQGFLTKQQKIDLYNELRKRSGSFVTYKGKRASFSRATQIEIEEFLAEDFRKYMLSNGKSLSTPVRNTLFRKILNFLKALFGNTTQAQLLINQQSVNTVRDLYQKLRIGNINEKDFSMDNVLFNILHKGPLSIDKATELNSDVAIDIVSTIDSIFSTFVDYHNSRNPDNRITNRVFSSNAGREAAYDETLTILEAERKKVQWKSTQESDPLVKAELERSLDTLTWMVNNFGDTKDPRGLKQKTETGDPIGVIAYHNLKSEFLSFEDKFEAEDNNLPEYLFKGGNEISVYDRGKSTIWYLIRGLHRIEDGKTVTNRLGFPELIDFDQTRRKITNILAGSPNRYVMQDRLKEFSGTYPYIPQLLFKLGDPRSLDEATFKTWGDFFQTFNSYRIPLPTMVLDKQGPSFVSKVGEASGEHKIVQRRWANQFTAGSTIVDPEILVKKPNTVTYLDVTKALNKYSQVNRSNLIQFLNDIGVPLSRTDDIIEEIQINPKFENVGRYLRERLVALKTNKIIVDSLHILFVKDVKNKYGEEKNESSRYDDFARLQAKYSGQFSDMVSTPSGDSRSEYSLNNSMTQTVKDINNAVTYSDLTNKYGFFDTLRNPFIRVSKRRQSLFNADGTRTNVPYQVENLNGLALTEDQEATGLGTSSAGADKFTKFILDLHLLIQRGISENPRHGEKSTSVSTFSRFSKDMAPYSKNGKLLIDPEHFLPGDRDIWRKIYDSVIPYLYAEHERVQIMRNLKPGAAELNYPDYVNNGKNFHIFDSTLSDTTKEVLYRIKEPLEEYLKKDTATARNLIKEINNDITRYYQDLFDQAELRFSKGGFIADSVMDDLLKTNRKDNPFKGLSRRDMTSTLLRTFEFNTWINNIESTIMHYGDPAQYKTEVEFHKRIAMFSSTGDIFASDPTTIEYINNKGMQYTKSLGLPEKVFSNKLAAGIMEDPVLRSVYYTEIYTALYDSARTRNYSDEGAKAVATLEARAYTNMKIGDAQGWITFDAYRALRIASNKWSNIQEHLYQKIVQGDYIDPETVLEYFPVAKYQYSGPLDTKEGLPVMAGHKYSLFPLIPNVINKSPVLKSLHERMMRDGIDYATLQSGSKITTVTNQGVVDKFYEDIQTRTFDNKPFTPNVVYLDYFKDQQNVNESYKESVTISTQMRKVIEDSFFKNGVPSDVNMDLYSWRKLPEKEKLKSEKYRMVIAYEQAVNNLTEEKKKEFIKEIGWSTPKTYGTVTPKLLSVIDKELARQDLGDHEREIIQLKNATSGLLLYDDLSYHLSAEKIERALTSLVNRKLVRQKMLGEPLVQVSVLGQESQNYIDLRGNLTYEEQLKYGTNDLAYYRPGKVTQAAKCKIAFMPAFQPLLNLIHNDGLPIQDTTRLNEMIKDEIWLNKLDHRRMISIVGPRIPVEGHNSMEFLEVYEFLDRTAGNIIVLPAEIVAKSGSDFDVDKVSMMIPHLKYDKRLGQTILFRNYSDKEVRELYGKVARFQVEAEKMNLEAQGLAGAQYDPAYNNLFNAIFGHNINDEDLDLLEILREEGTLPSFEDFKDSLNGTKQAENEFIYASQKLLEHKDNYASLIRPNGTFTLDPIVNGTESKEGIRDHVSDYNPRNTVQGTRKGISGSKLMEYGYNNYVHQINKVSLEALGIAAVDNTANVIFNRVGAHMAFQYLDRTRRAKPGDVVTKRITLQVPHNIMKDESGRDTVSLSDLNDADGRLRVSGNIEQMINLLLEIAKNDSAFYLQLNREVIPTLLFLNQAGVPIEHLIHFASQPILRQYYDQIRIARSPVAGALKKAPEKRNFFKNKARAIMYQEVLGYSPNFARGTDQASFNPRMNVRTIQQLYDNMNNLINANPNAFNKDRLYNNILKPNETFTDDDKAVLLHWFEIEDMANAVRDIKIRVNPDTKRSISAFLSLSKSKQIEELSSDGRIPPHIVEGIMKDSAISSLASVSISQGDVPSFMIDFLKPLFPIRTDKRIAEFLLNKMNSMQAMEEIESTFGDAEKFATRFYNDLMSYIFQNKLRDFKIGNITKYRNMNAQETLDVQQIPYLKFGAFVKDNIMYYDMDQLVRDFSNRNYTNQSYRDRGLAIIPQDQFKNAKEFYNYVFEREYIRSYLTPTDAGTDYYFTDLKVKNQAKVAKKESESQDEYQTRLNHITYEQYIRDKALDNIGNGKKIFEGESSFSSQVMDAIDRYDLTRRYPILGMLTENIGKGRIRTRNLQLLDTDLTSSKTEAFHKVLKDLADPSVSKTPDEQENLRLSELFNRFPMVAFLQSGLTSSGAFSLTRLVPNRQFTDFIQGAVNSFMKGFKPEYLENFYKKFITESTKGSRYKDYVREDTSKVDKPTLRQAGMIPIFDDERVVSVYQSGRGFLTYDPKGVTLKSINFTLRDPSDILFVYDLAMNPKSKPTSTEGVFSTYNQTNQTLGIPTLNYYDRTSLNLNQADTSLTDKTLEKNKTLIDEAIQNLISMRDAGSIPVFSINGYGQRMLGLEADGVTRIKLIKGKPGLKTFLYLSQSLYETFGYVNKNYDVQELPAQTTDEIMEPPLDVLSKNQPLSDNEVREIIKRCL